MLTAVLAVLLLRTFLGFVRELPKTNTPIDTIVCIAVELTLMGGLIMTMAVLNGHEI